MGLFLCKLSVTYKFSSLGIVHISAIMTGYSLTKSLEQFLFPNYLEIISIFEV